MTSAVFFRDDGPGVARHPSGTSARATRLISKLHVERIEKAGMLSSEVEQLFGSDPGFPAEQSTDDSYTRSGGMPNKCGIYLDACCFIDMMKEAAGQSLATDRANDVWFLKQITQACRDGERDVYTSVISIAECTHADGDMSPKVKSTFASLLRSGQYVKLVQPPPFSATDARDLRWVHARDLRWVHNISMRGADTIHIASALDRKCEEFITTDGQLRRVGGAVANLLQLGMRIIPAHETKCLPAKYRFEKKLDKIATARACQIDG
jgi:hypothetical protein